MKSTRPPAPAASETARPPLAFRAEGAWLSHEGKLRGANEDACLAGLLICEPGSVKPASFQTSTNPWIVAVADGIGGHRGGAEASLEVVAGLAACVRVTPAGVAALLRNLNLHLAVRGLRDPALKAMGATVAGVGGGPRGLFAFNVGDSRVYRQRAGRLTQITRDDSQAEDLIEQGLLTRGDEARPGFLHALTQAIGGREQPVKIKVHTHRLAPEPGDRFLICSDGLTDMLVPSQIEQIMTAHRKAKAAVGALFAAAMEAGGLDNITIAILEMTGA